MNDKAKTTLVPKLRFPEFQYAGEWTKEKLGSLASISTEKVGSKVCVPMSITSGVGLVSQEDKFGRVIAGDSYKNYLLLEPSDFAYNKSATKEYPEGFLAMYSGDRLAAVPNSIFTCFRVKGDSTDPRYLNYLFLGNLHGRWLRKFIQVGARAHGSLSINDSDLLALPIPLPEGKSSLAEQRKIADALNSVDDLIAALARKVDTLKTYKKGLMQQLFPREGETKPRLRFPEFNSAGEWVPKTIGQLGEVVTGNTPSTTKSEYYGGDRHFVSPSDISESRFIEKTKTTLTELGFFETRPIKANSILFVCIGSTIGKIAQNREECATNQQINAVTPNSENFEGFVYYALSQIAGKIANIAGKQAVPIVNKTLFSSFSLVVPKLPEQKRIANFLSSLDEVILGESQQLDTLRTHKKGLMQQLFPSSEDSHDA
ncbi:restriction endonuclease subunit S [Pseudoduganella danionis]|uniref:Restriction endonuclease subunit S n=1 Tax=Pseudoduganella danionis TaxID=1890295 RepID=A0ABW9SSU3_9BURK|nr:restriction endonuclease subunit S [Pseudoduganella danionis]MTW34258.1 restriction endonuclease subunit S [Pseudoduganella danionis]